MDSAFNYLFSLITLTRSFILLLSFASSPTVSLFWSIRFLFVVRRYSLQQRVALSVSPVKQFSPADGQIFAVSAFGQCASPAWKKKEKTRGKEKRRENIRAGGWKIAGSHHARLAENPTVITTLALLFSCRSAEKRECDRRNNNTKAP